MATATEQAVHGQAARLEIPTIVRYLQEALGQRLTALIAGVSSAKMVRAWSSGEATPHPATQQRLRHAFQVTQFLMGAESSETVRAWFLGMNPALDDRAPALVIGEDPARVLQAARTFVANND